MEFGENPATVRGPGWERTRDGRRLHSGGNWRAPNGTIGVCVPVTSRMQSSTSQVGT